MNKIQVYLLPGLGANTRIFERLEWPEEVSIHPMDLLQPLSKEESIEEYIRRFCKTIDREEGPKVIIGVSFGGIIAQEMAKYLEFDKIIIISSIKSNRELSPSLQFFKKTNTYKLFPSKQLGNIEKLALKISSGKTKIRISRYDYYLTRRDPLYIDWCIDKIMNWKQEESKPGLIHIQGEKDEIFPVKHLKGYIPIAGGDHAMIITKAKKISQILKRELYEMR